MRLLTILFRHSIKFLFLLYFCALGYFGVHMYRIFHESGTVSDRVFPKDAHPVVTKNSLHTYGLHNGKRAEVVAGLLKIQRISASGRMTLTVPHVPASWNNDFFPLFRHQRNRFLEIMGKGSAPKPQYGFHYYKNLDLFDYVGLMLFHRRLDTKLPDLQAFFKRSAAKYGFDWRLIAAQAYQESQFDSDARSHAGAYGLMQLMPRTAESLGVINIKDPEENIDAGVRHLKNLHTLFPMVEEPDRTYFALAAYNAGHGHLLDAKDLAKNLGMNPDKWASLEKTLPLLEQEKYFSAANYGYCRGTETVKYLRKILIYYDIIQHRSFSEDRGSPKGRQSENPGKEKRKISMST